MGDLLAIHGYHLWCSMDFGRFGLLNDLGLRCGFLGLVSLNVPVRGTFSIAGDVLNFRLLCSFGGIKCVQIGYLGDYTIFLCLSK